VASDICTLSGVMVGDLIGSCLFASACSAKSARRFTAASACLNFLFSSNPVDDIRFAHDSRNEIVTCWLTLIPDVIIALVIRYVL